MEENHKCPDGLPAWLATFADLMSLLLCFFVLIVSFSSMQQVEFNKAMGSLRGALGILSSKRAIVHLDAQPTTPLQFRKLSMIWEKLQEMKETISEQGLKDFAKVQSSKNSIRFTLQDELLFESGKSNLKRQILPLLRKIAEMNIAANGVLRIEGHTDNVPIQTRQFPSNWELSSSRALNVLHYFENLGIERTKLACSGFSDTRPLVVNDSAANRAKNRRVEIYLELVDLYKPVSRAKTTDDVPASNPKFITPTPKRQ
ncbi:MAG: hypothetical protein DWQ10_09355 [Calditrichaeota bacterium]|nr:MAG: hypothetical protein DWQ10_09355 [Calditrichota bacterium]